MFSSLYSIAESAAKKVTDFVNTERKQLEATRKNKADDAVHHPKTYKLIDSRNDPREEKNKSTFSCYVVGCIGEKGDAQAFVAELMDKLAREQPQPKCIIFLGDNFYPRGAISPDDPVFKEQFEKIYQADKLGILKNIPCFFIGGNHCHNIYRWGGDRGWAIDYQRIEAQIKHTFVTEGKEDPEKVKLYDQDVLDLGTLQPWNMPRRFYSCVVQPESDIELYFLDTNTYVKDYLNHLKNEAAGKPDPNNQATWLETEMAKNQKAVKLGFHHHPRYTAGKRYFQSDADLYLDPKDFEELARLGITGNYNDILDKIFKQQRLVFDSNYSAHDHSMYYFVSDGVSQVVSGGGGGELQSRESYANSDKMPCFLKQNGFVRVSVDTLKDKENRVINEFITTANHHLAFNKTAIPLRQNDWPDAFHKNVWKALTTASYQFLDSCKYAPSMFTKMSNSVARQNFLDPGKINSFINTLNSFEGFSLLQVATELAIFLNDDTTSTYRRYLDAAFKAENVGKTVEQFILENANKLVIDPQASDKKDENKKNEESKVSTPKSPFVAASTMYDPTTFGQTISTATKGIPDSNNKNRAAIFEF